MPVVCKICNKIFSRQFTLNRHVREIHKEDVTFISYAKEVWNFKCLESNCCNSFQKGKFLMQHLEEIHNLKFENETVVFENIDEFINWKQRLEVESCSMYVVSKYKKNKSITYYNCNRSKTGHNQNRDPEKVYKRNLKAQGLYHMSSSCTSQMKVEYSGDGKATVNFQKIHYGHDVELSKIRIPKQERNKVAAKLISGVPPKKIAQNVYDAIGENLKRIDLLTMKDIQNIKRSFGIDIQEGKRHENDAISLDIWVQENISSDNNPILYYKKQGIESQCLRTEDFCLIIANNFQKVMLQKFGNNTLTIDGTHGLNCYDFELTTLMVLDEFKQGFPVAFMFSNKKDSYVYQIFFQCIKHEVGGIQPKVFMTDLAEAYFNAWVTIMGAGDTKHLYCAWHVDRAWQSNIKKVRGLQKQTEVKKIIRTLQQNTTQQEFEACLHNTITLLLNDDETKEFGKYFSNNYVSNHKKWAYCFRKDSPVNTNMHVEAMHKILKYIYADRKTIRRLDKGVHLILQFLRDKSRERIIKLIKGKSTDCTKNIFKRHCEAQKLKNYFLKFSDGVWQVTNNLSTTYFIKQQKLLNCCRDICFTCNICRHIYTCTCEDHFNQKLICKHIHYMMLQTQANKEAAIEESSNKNQSDSELFCGLLDTQNQNSEENLNKKISKVVCKLQSFDYHSVDDDTLEMIHYHLNIVENLTKLSQTNEGTQSFNIKNASNKRYIDPQLRFFSVKKKRQKPTSTITKLSDMEKQETKKLLKNEPALVISNNSAEDHIYCKVNP